LTFTGIAYLLVCNIRHPTSLLFHLNNLFSDTLSFCTELSFTPIPGYGPSGVAQKNDDRLQAGVTTFAHCFGFFFKKIKTEVEIIVKIDGYTEEIEGYGVQLYGT